VSRWTDYDLMHLVISLKMALVYFMSLMLG